MTTDDLQAKIEQVIDKTFEILRSGNSQTRLVFATYSNDKRRVSEQELRFVFVEQLQQILQDYDLYYSVETPTKSRYLFSEKRKYVEPCISDRGKSASFDLTIKDSNGNNVAILEFKAKNAHPHEYAKDICKLWNPEEKAKYKYFINLFEKIEQKTKESFLGKLNPTKSNKFLSLKTSSEQIIVIAQSLRSADEKIKVTI